MISSSYPRYAGDGIGSFVRSLARALVDSGREVHVVAPYDPSVADMDHGGVCVHRFRYAPCDALCLVGHGRSLKGDVRMRWIVPLLMPGFVIAATVRALSLHRSERSDLIHGHWAVPGGAIAAVVAWLTGLPLVISLHGSDVYVAEGNRVYAAVARAAFRRAAHVTASSEDLRDRAALLGLDRARSSVIPYGVDADRYAAGQGTHVRDRLGIPPDALVIGALGRLVHKKGFGHLLSAMQGVLGAVPEAYCVIGGEGDLRDDLTAQVDRLGVSGRVLFAGHVDWRDTPGYYAMCDVVVVPSVVDARGNVDGLPNVLLEAMASGTAVVASRVGGIPEVVTDGEDGLLVTPGDANALVGALISLLGDPALRMRLGERARQRISAGYAWRDVVRSFEVVYDEAVGSGARTRGG